MLRSGRIEPRNELRHRTGGQQRQRRGQHQIAVVLAVADDEGDPTGDEQQDLQDEHRVLRLR